MTSEQQNGHPRRVQNHRLCQAIVFLGQPYISSLAGNLIMYYIKQKILSFCLSAGVEHLLYSGYGSLLVCANFEAQKRKDILATRRKPFMLDLACIIQKRSL